MNQCKILHTYTDVPRCKKGKLHTHDFYEIYLLLEGDVKFSVENKVYALEPRDMIIIKKNQLHSILIEEAVTYQCVVLHIDTTFFQENNCTEHEEFFLNLDCHDNKIPGRIVKTSGLYDAFKKYEKYSEGYKFENTSILKAVIIEILYLINKAKQFETSNYATSRINDVITYLNEHYTEHIDLYILEQQFFFSRKYLCRVFKATTGITITDYIRKKRMKLVQDLVGEGRGFAEAARMSGFCDYSSFYRAYRKEYGISPRTKLNRKK